MFEPIHEELELVEERLRGVVSAEHSFPADPLTSLLDCGGKRIRPALVILASKFHACDAEKVLSLAASVELLHTATLVHDDLLDGSLLRRGNPTLNASLSTEAVILIGDYLFARAADLAASTKSVPIVTIFAQTLMTICSGELRQAFDDGDRLRSRDHYYQSIDSKTASLFAASAEAGGVLSGARTAMVDAFRAYGRNLGMAFQILDDILDFTGDEKELGKPIGSDLRQGLITLPLLLFLEMHPKADIGSAIRGGVPGREEKIQDLVGLVSNSAAISSAWDEAERFTVQSKEAAQSLPPNEYREVMLDLADHLLDRRR